MKTFIVIVCLIGLSYGAEWTYEGEYRWPGVCTSGTQQSPINILTRDAVIDRHAIHIRGPLVFRGYGEVTTSALNNGHTLKWSALPGTQAPVVSGGPLRGNYTFLQFHLHWLSEHAIDGYKYPLEIHMVHIKTGLTISEALKRPDGLAVIGVLCVLKSGAEAEQALAQIVPSLPDLVYRGENQTTPEVIDLTPLYIPERYVWRRHRLLLLAVPVARTRLLRDAPLTRAIPTVNRVASHRLLSPQPQSFYTYHGSLTTPDCQEVVTWIVMDKPLTISDNQYKLFNKINIGESAYNFRSLHPTNRIVYRSVSSCASIATPTFVGFLFSLFSCAKSIMAATLGKGVCILANMKRRVFGGRVKECSKLL